MGESGKKSLKIEGTAYIGVSVSACLDPDLSRLPGTAARWSLQCGAKLSVAAVSMGMVVRFQLALEFMKLLLKLLHLLLNCLDALIVIWMMVVLR